MTGYAHCKADLAALIANQPRSRFLLQNSSFCINH